MTNSNTPAAQPEALRLAQTLQWYTDRRKSVPLNYAVKAATELRRLHAEAEAQRAGYRDEQWWLGWNAAMRARLPAAQADSFQQRVRPWLLECFGAEIAADRLERNHRFLEEALELVQSLDCTASEAHQLVDYVFGRPVGEPLQEAGGVMVTLAALCLASGLDMHQAGETELARISVPELVAKIRAKQAAKPKHSPLPESVRAGSGVQEDAALLRYALADGGNQRMNWQDIYDDWNGEGYFRDELKAAMTEDAALAAKGCA